MTDQRPAGPELHEVVLMTDEGPTQRFGPYSTKQIAESWAEYNADCFDGKLIVVLRGEKVPE